ncbi:MAG: hypothetical protein HZC28_17970 [Spirochaetes bacterium]|nr:hypothetical protein [Spirochaetota bacterium]
MDSSGNVSNGKIGFFSGLKKIDIPLIILLAVVLRAVRVFWGLGACPFTLIDETDAYIFSFNLFHFSHASFFTKLPGPFENLAGFLSVHAFGSVAGMYILSFLLQILTLILLYLFLKKIADGTIVRIGLLVYAVHPWAVGYGSSFWNPYFIIPLITGALILMLDIFDTKRSWKIVPFIFLFGCMPFFHGISLFAGVAVVLLCIIYRPRLHWQWLAAGVLAAAALYIPFIYFDAQKGYMIIGGYFHQAKTAVQFTVESLKGLTNPFIVLFPDGSRFVGHTMTQYTEFAKRFFLHPSVVIIGVVPYALAAIYGCYLFCRRAFVMKSRVDQLLLFFAIFTSALFLLTFRPNEERYMVIIWPILFYMLALGIAGAFQRWRAPWLRGVFIFMLVFAAYMSVAVIAYQRNPNNGSAYRIVPSLMYFEKIEDTILRHYDIRPVHLPRIYPQSSDAMTARRYTNSSRSVNVSISFDVDKQDIFDWDNRLRNWLFSKYISYNQWVCQPAGSAAVRADVVITSRERMALFAAKDYVEIGKLPNGVVLIKER